MQVLCAAHVFASPSWGLYSYVFYFKGTQTQNGTFEHGGWGWEVEENPCHMPRRGWALFFPAGWGVKRPKGPCWGALSIQCWFPWSAGFFLKEGGVWRFGIQTRMGVRPSKGSPDRPGGVLAYTTEGE